MYIWMAIFTCRYIKTICEWVNRIECYCPNMYMVFVKMLNASFSRKIDKKNIHISSWIVLVLTMLQVSVPTNGHQILQFHHNSYIVICLFLHKIQWILNKGASSETHGGKKNPYFNYPGFGAVVSPDLLRFAWLDVQPYIYAIYPILIIQNRLGHLEHNHDDPWEWSGYFFPFLCSVAIFKGRRELIYKLIVCFYKGIPRSFQQRVDGNQPEHYTCKHFLFKLTLD